ncbi:MAG: hypothetical protein JSU95_13860 [Betaproteobacteria bacterium]|nr:MAG: hypothetical protein JSU95_13860 [Betaproteobacteria bacterium]
MHIKCLAGVLGLALTSLVTQASAVCGQIAPNPNPVGSTISNGRYDACNEQDRFNNFGSLFNTGILDNSGELRNFGTLINVGTLNNFGDLVNVQSSDGRVKNSGTLNNFGTVSGYGSTENTGILNNYDTLSAGDFGKNTGVVNNLPGATLSSGQRFTNEGVVQNSLGGTVKTRIGWINYATVSNSGTFDFANSRFLNNHGILKNNPGAKLITGRETENTGSIQNDGTLTNDGTIYTSGQFVVSLSGRLMGSGSFRQFAGSTVVDGAMTQSSVVINGGVLSGAGKITSTLAVDGGTLARATSLDVMTISGDYIQTAAGKFATYVVGRREENKHGLLNVSGRATLDGVLDVRIIKFRNRTFSPEQGDTFDILSAESIVGTFQTVLFSQLGENLSWKVSYLLDAYNNKDVVRLEVVRISEE